MSRTSAAPRTAEWILARFIGPERSAALIGDLLEESAARTHPALRFWVQTLWLIARFTARSIAAYSVAFLALNWTFGRTIMAILREQGMHRPSNHWLSTVTLTDQAGCLFFALAAFSLLRFGPRTRLTWISLSFATITLTAIFFWWSPIALSLAATVLCSTLAVSLRDRRSRQTLLVLAAATTAAVGFQMAVLWFNHLASLRRHANWLASHPPSLIFFFLYALWMTPIVPAAIASSLYSRYVLRISPEEQSTVPA